LCSVDGLGARSKAQFNFAEHFYGGNTAFNKFVATPGFSWTEGHFGSAFGALLGNVTYGEMVCTGGDFYGLLAKNDAISLGADLAADRAKFQQAWNSFMQLAPSDLSYFRTVFGGEKAAIDAVVQAGQNTESKYAELSSNLDQDYSRASRLQPPATSRDFGSYARDLLTENRYVVSS